MTTPQLSTYWRGKSRATVTFLAVLQRLSVPNMNRILGTLLGDGSYMVASLDNQIRKISTPHLKIGAGQTIWIETVAEHDGVNLAQVKKRLKAVGEGEKLLLLTPDDDEPKGLPDKVVWSNFRDLTNVAEEIFVDNEMPLSEQEESLLRQFISLLRQDGLTTSSEKRVMVVSAGDAWPRYNEQGIYGDIRSPNWKPSDHLAFYTGMEIKPIVPIIKSTSILNITNSEEVKTLESSSQESANQLLEWFDNHKQREDVNKPLMVISLSEPTDDETLHLKDGPIIGDAKDKNGKPIAWIFMTGAKYVTLDSLKNVRYTGELELC